MVLATDRQIRAGRDSEGVMDVSDGDENGGPGPWLARLAKGDPSALDELYDHFGPQCYRYALGMLGRAEAAEDALQELFLELARARGRLGPVRSGRAYLFAMLRHAVWRRLRRSRERSGEPAAVFERPLPSGIPESAALDVESALAGLPAEQREVVVLKIYQDMTFAEIADATRVSQNTAASRYRYAIERLRELLPPDLLEGH